MSELTTAARPYARAVFETAQESGELADWSDALSLLGAVVSNKEVGQLLSNPNMAKQAGADALISLCDSKLNKKAENLVIMLSENNRLLLLPEVSAIFETLKDEAEGSVEARVATAKALTKAEEEAIAKALKKRLGRDVKLNVSVDESLLGGAIIHAGDLVIDGSLQGRLKKMTSVMMN